MTFRRTLASILFGVGVSLSLADRTEAQTVTFIPYFENFATDPNWNVNNPLIGHHDTFDGGVYEIFSQPSGFNHHVDIEIDNYHGGSFMLEWDYMPTSIGVNSFFGFFENYNEEVGPGSNRSSDIAGCFFHNGEMHLNTNSEDLSMGDRTPDNNVQINNWYHNIITYNATSGDINWVVTEGKGVGGSIITSANVNNYGNFSTLKYLGMRGFADGGGTGYIDNVELTHLQEIPIVSEVGLAAMVMGVIGAGAYVLKKRGNLEIKEK